MPMWTTPVPAAVLAASARNASMRRIKIQATTPHRSRRHDEDISASPGALVEFQIALHVSSTHPPAVWSSASILQSSMHQIASTARLVFFVDAAGRRILWCCRLAAPVTWLSGDEHTAHSTQHLNRAFPDRLAARKLMNPNMVS